MEPDKAKQKLMFSCARSEQCRYDLKKKLIRWQIAEEDRERILDYLEDEKFIDENRYASLFVRDKFRINKWGREKIKYQLRGKRIHPDTIERAMTEIDLEAYKEVLNDLLKQKKESLENDQADQIKPRLIRYAMSRGFEMGPIMEILNSLD